MCTCKLVVIELVCGFLSHPCVGSTGSACSSSLCKCPTNLCRCPTNMGIGWPSWPPTFKMLFCILLIICPTMCLCADVNCMHTCTYSVIFFTYLCWTCSPRLYIHVHVRVYICTCTYNELLMVGNFHGVLIFVRI